MTDQKEKQMKDDGIIPIAGDMLAPRYAQKSTTGFSVRIKMKFTDETRLQIKETSPLLQVVDRFSFPGWESLFKEQRDNLKHISEVLDVKCPEFLPMRRDVFRVFELPPDEVRVVILGQDPYFTRKASLPDAVGLSFSCSSGINPSLMSIYSEIHSEYLEFRIPGHGDLSSWLKKGVFLLNTALTVEEGKPASHLILWKSFTDAVLQRISECTGGKCVYFLWGAPARKAMSVIGSGGLILETTHPSPRSAYRGFYGCGHFKKCNEYLTAHGLGEIDWSLPES